MSFVFNSSHTPLYAYSDAPRATPAQPKGRRGQSFVFGLLLVGLVAATTQLGFGLPTSNSASALSLEAAAPKTAIASAPAQTTTVIVTTLAATSPATTTQPSVTKLPSGVASAIVTPLPTSSSSGTATNSGGHTGPVVIIRKPVPAQEPIQKIDWTLIAVVAAKTTK